MTELDHLRELLDEVGVVYLNRSSDITIGYYTVDPHSVIEAMDHSLQVTGLTAEQAMLALVHSSNCTNSGRTFANSERIGDERGMCHLERASWDDGTCTWGCICSACDAHLEHETGIGYNYCPICGAKVVDA